MPNFKNFSNSKLSTTYLTGLIIAMAGQFASAGDNHTATNTPQSNSNGEPDKIVATQINPHNVTNLQRHGPDAIGGINDWFISNGTLCAVISDIAHESEFSTTGGSLVDLGFCGRHDDHITSTHDLINGSRLRPLNGKRISIENFNRAPSIVVESVGDGAQLTTRYHFDSAHPTRLHISKRYTSSISNEGNDFNFVSPLNFNLRSLEPFVFNSREPQLSNGFQNEDFVERGTAAIRKAARSADTIIFPSPRSAKNSISYGWQLRSAQRVSAQSRIDVPFYMLADPQSTAMMVLTDTFWIGDGEKLGWLQLPQIPLLELDSSDALETEEILYVGRNGDVASITDQLLSTEPKVSGNINTPNTAIHIHQTNGSPLTHIIPNKSGKFSFKAPFGDYVLTAYGYGDRKVEQEFTISNNTSLKLKDIALPKAAKLELPTGHAMRLLFVGLDGTPDPDFSGELTKSSVAFDDHVELLDPISTVFLAGVSSDISSVDIAAGKYLVYATKGPEFSLEKTEVSVQNGDTRQLNITPPRRIIDTPKYIASDLHVHSGLSFDNAFSESERVRTFAAEHGEVMVASEHDVPTDYSQYIEELGVTEKITAIPAVEVTSILPTKSNPYSGGHANVFPFTPKHHHHRNGLFNHEDTRLRDTIHQVKERGEQSVVQLNHPRHDLTLTGKELPKDWHEIIDHGNYLDHMGSAAHPYNPHKPLTSFPNNTLIEKHPDTGIRDLDFDLIEVINPGRTDQDERVRAVRQDWLSFLKQGEHIIGTANSDSHTAFEQVAVPRTMVAMQNDSIVEFNQKEFIANLKSGNAYGTTGPMLEVSLQDKEMGETFSGMQGTLTVNISRVPWVNVDKLAIQINGVTVDTHQLNDRQQQTVKIPLEFDRDSFVTIEVFGPASEDYVAVYPGLKPYAFSNPIYVDFDRDGNWLAPGLSVD